MNASAFCDKFLPVSARFPTWPTAPVETSYATVSLTPDTDGTGVLLLIDGTESSHLNLTDPTALMFEYMQHMQAVLQTQLPAATPTSRGRPRVLHLGGAGCAFARAIHAEWPACHQVAIEIDARLAELVRQWFDLPRSPHLRIRVQDAAEAVRAAPAARYEVVVRDAFAHRTVPDHLTTEAFTRDVRRCLSPGGLYLANCADHPPLTGARREAATVAAVFPHVAVIVEPGILRGRRYGNVVLVGSDDPLDARLHRLLGTLPAPARLLQGPEALAFIGSHLPLSAPQ